MNHRIRNLLIILAVVVALLLTGSLIFYIVNFSQQETTVPLASDRISSIYANAITVLSETPDLTLNISTKESTTTANQSFPVWINQTVAFKDRHTQKVCVSVKETHHIGQHSISVDEYYRDGSVYATIAGSYFQTEQTVDNFLSGITPAQLLNLGLYNEISGLDTGSEYIIFFKQATAIETWAADQSQQFVDAWGTAQITKDGQLTRSTYYIATTSENVTYYRSFDVDLAYTAEIIPPHAPLKEYKPVADLNSLITLERTCGYLLQAANISATSTDSIYFQAFGDGWEQNISIRTEQKEAEWSACVDTDKKITNTGRPGEVTVSQKTEQFIDGIYSVSENGAPLTSDDGISKDSVQSYCNNLLLSTVVLLEFVTDTTVTQEKGLQSITFHIDPSFADVITSNACQILYGRPDLLDAYKNNSTIDTLEAYLKIDALTGLPVASGIHYCGSYTIDATPYQLRYQADQSYNIMIKAADA